MRLFKSVIFDVDGTLLDSMCIWENVAPDYLRSRGATPRADLNEALSRLGGHEIPGYFRSEYGLRESVDEIMRGIYKLLEDFYLHKAPLKKGVIPVLSALSELGIKMSIATATEKYLIDSALERLGIRKHFKRIFSCGEEMTSKSSPDIYLRAAVDLGTAISETLIVEDALYAIRSAKSAGFPVAAVYDKSALDYQDEIKQLCDYYFMSMDEMLGLL